IDESPDHSPIRIANVERMAMNVTALMSIPMTHPSDGEPRQNVSTRPNPSTIRIAVQIGHIPNMILSAIVTVTTDTINIGLGWSMSNAIMSAIPITRTAPTSGPNVPGSNPNVVPKSSINPMNPHRSIGYLIVIRRKTQKDWRRLEPSRPLVPPTHTGAKCNEDDRNRCNHDAKDEEQGCKVHKPGNRTTGRIRCSVIHGIDARKQRAYESEPDDDSNQDPNQSADHLRR